MVNGRKISAIEATLPSILELSKSNLLASLEALDQPKYRAEQVWRAIYKEGRTSFGQMTNLSKDLRGILAQNYSIGNAATVISKKSADNSTDKILFKLPDGELIETVLMRYEPDGHRRGRKTVCVSTQAGCALGCTFCATGQQGFRRNLTAGEITEQVLTMERLALAEDKEEIQAGTRSRGELQGVTNVVFMGMGEPLANYENMMESIWVLNDPKGIGIGARHITVSTVGLVPGIEKLAKENIQINLAVSLHAPDNETRSETMPVNKRYPIEELIEACKYFVTKTNRRIFIEYVLLKDQNDTSMHANKLGRILKDLLCHVNLIPVNPTDDGPYHRTTYKEAQRFQSDLKTFNVPSTVRMEKGIDIDAGCGQLRDRALALTE
ncbi:MAG: 23S rRNA (adenine(2503)-C(2))-methyltransferase RlmN [SAR202 cluster bacterium]|jgi:23S rRNA (adenine2503-C2)-methyltransferase|nr:23S rRNA (adenine(2503)-C(2))-methyltransferase RlmN [SAR202 cluster bacterium]|tara:strand:+ start:19619 stop:20761 length:1143 start_codon:yes stop_codon:yes gene_type:complete